MITFCDTVGILDQDLMPILIILAIHSGTVQVVGPPALCCQFNNPWFQRALPQATTSDDIDLRLCLGEEASTDGEDAIIYLIVREGLFQFLLLARPSQFTNFDCNFINIIAVLVLNNSTTLYIHIYIYIYIYFFIACGDKRALTYS